MEIKYEDFTFALDFKTAGFLRMVSDHFGMTPEEYIKDAVCELLLADHEMLDLE